MTDNHVNMSVVTEPLTSAEKCLMLVITLRKGLRTYLRHHTLHVETFRSLLHAILAEYSARGQDQKYVEFEVK